MHDYDGQKGFLGHSFDGCVFEDFPTSHPLGGAGLVSTLHDYSRFAEMLLNKGENIITPDSVRLMSTPHVPYSIQQRNKRWGLAVKVVTDESYDSLPLGAYGYHIGYDTPDIKHFLSLLNLIFDKSNVPSDLLRCPVKPDRLSLISTVICEKHSKTTPFIFCPGE